MLPNPSFDPRIMWNEPKLTAFTADSIMHAKTFLSLIALKLIPSHI